MQFETNAILSLSVGVGATVGWVQFRKADPAFFPFILLLTAGFVTELCSIFLIHAGYSNAIVYNLFILLESMLITYQFYLWQLFKKHPTIFRFTLVLFASVWLTEFIYRSSIVAFHSYFIIISSTVLVFMSIHMMNVLLFKDPKQLYLNPLFIICTSFIFYFTYTIIVEVFWVYGLNKSTVFRVRIYQIFSYINLFTNLLFAYACLWIPKKQPYILR